MINLLCLTDKLFSEEHKIGELIRKLFHFGQMVYGYLAYSFEKFHEESCKIF